MERRQADCHVNKVPRTSSTCADLCCMDSKELQLEFLLCKWTHVTLVNQSHTWGQLGDRHERSSQAHQSSGPRPLVWEEFLCRQVHRGPDSKRKLLQPVAPGSPHCPHGINRTQFTLAGSSEPRTPHRTQQRPCHKTIGRTK